MEYIKFTVQITVSEHLEKKGAKVHGRGNIREEEGRGWEGLQ